MIFSHIITIYGNNIIQFLLTTIRKKRRIYLHEKIIFILDQTEVNITLKGRKIIMSTEIELLNCYMTFQTMNLLFPFSLL